MKYLSNGCSHSSDIMANERGFHRDDYTYSYLLNEYLKKQGNSHSWKRLQHPGKGNGAIFHDTIRALCNKKYGYYDFATVQFSSANRRMYQLPDGKRLHINPYDWTEYGVLFEPQASHETLNFILTLQRIFKLAKTPYLMMCYFPIERTEESENFVNSVIDLDRFVSFDDNTHPIFDGWIDSMKNKKNWFKKDFPDSLISDEQGHPSFEGHKYIFSRFKEKLSNKIL